MHLLQNNLKEQLKLLRKEQLKGERNNGCKEKERTKEIGIRRAIGASPSHIRKQIILESVFLTIIAGIIGIILGAFILYIVNISTQNLEDVPFTNATVPINFIVGALLLMISLGTLIGFIPAEKAISIKPIEALKDE